jgi:hypothetical protein
VNLVECETSLAGEKAGALVEGEDAVCERGAEELTLGRRCERRVAIGAAETA